MDKERALLELQELRDILNKKEIFLVNPDVGMGDSPVCDSMDVALAEERVVKSLPFFKKLFAFGNAGDLEVESPLMESRLIREEIEKTMGFRMGGKVFLKCDNLFPVTGSSLDRVWLNEILGFAEDVAEDNGMDTGDDYGVFYDKSFHDLFAQYTVVIGAYEKMGRAAALVGADLGFNIILLVDEKTYGEAKELTRGNLAVRKWGEDPEETRKSILKEKEKDPFVLYLWEANYANMALVIMANMKLVQKQMKDRGIIVDHDHPLFMILPRGGLIDPSPMAYYIRQEYGENAHCFIGESTEKPDISYRLVMNEGEKSSLKEFTEELKLDFQKAGRFAATDAGRRMAVESLDGAFTVSPDSIKRWKNIVEEETGGRFGMHDGISPEGVLRISRSYAYLLRRGLTDKMENATFLLWLAGV